MNNWNICVQPLKPHKTISVQPFGFFQNIWHVQHLDTNQIYAFLHGSRPIRQNSRIWLLEKNFGEPQLHSILTNLTQFNSLVTGSASRYRYTVPQDQMLGTWHGSINPGNPIYFVSYRHYGFWTTTDYCCRKVAWGTWYHRSAQFHSICVQLVNCWSDSNLLFWAIRILWTHFRWSTWRKQTPPLQPLLPHITLAPPHLPHPLLPQPNNWIHLCLQICLHRKKTHCIVNVYDLPMSSLFYFCLPKQSLLLM